MTTFRPKLWTGVSAVVLASTLGLAACGGEGGEAGATGQAAPGAAAPAGEGGEGGAEGGQPATAAPVGEGGEGGAEGAGSEQGAAAAYSGVPAGSRDALRLAHLRGFFLAAREQTGEEAAALAGQGLLEVYDPSRTEFARLGVTEATLRRAAETGSRADLDRAIADINAARARAGGEPAAVVRAMTDVAAGLYRETIVDGGVDPIEYQHSRGAALSAQAEVRAASALSSARADVDRFVALWPSADAPEAVAQASTVQQVQAQASRLQLALS